MSRFLDGYGGLQSEIAKVKDFILDTVKDLPAVYREHLNTIISGKFLRPLFCILAAKFGNRGGGSVIAAAASIELLHIATLIHDDIIDDAGTRRGVESTHCRFGTRRAVILGDYLFSKSVQLVTSSGAVEYRDLLASAVVRIASGELAQQEDRYARPCSVRMYLRRIIAKTAALFMLSFTAGAVEGGCRKNVRDLFRRTGYCVGMAFQIMDDILDFEGSPERLGKPSATDFRSGIYTLPVVLAHRDDPGIFEKYAEFRNSDRNGTAALVGRLAEGGWMQQARGMAGMYTERAVRHIRSLPARPERAVIEDLVKKLLDRED